MRIASDLRPRRNEISGLPADNVPERSHHFGAREQYIDMPLQGVDEGQRWVYPEYLCGGTENRPFLISEAKGHRELVQRE